MIGLLVYNHAGVLFDRCNHCKRRMQLWRNVWLNWRLRNNTVKPWTGLRSRKITPRMLAHYCQLKHNRYSHLQGHIWFDQPRVTRFRRLRSQSREGYKIKCSKSDHIWSNRYMRFTRAHSMAVFWLFVENSRKLEFYSQSNMYAPFNLDVLIANKCPHIRSCKLSKHTPH